MSRLTQEILHSYHHSKVTVFLIASLRKMDSCIDVALKLHKELERDWGITTGLLSIDLSPISSNIYEQIKTEMLENDIAILCSDGFLENPEATLLLSFAKRTILVVDAGQTTSDEIELFIKILKDREVQLLGSVMVYEKLPMPVDPTYLEEEL